MAISTSEMSNSTDDNKRVSFGHIQVRDYERIAGDHPEVNGGVPLSIGWAFVQKDAVTVDRAENSKNLYRMKEMAPLSPSTRESLLLRQFEVSKKDIQQSTKLAKQTRTKRHHTLEKHMKEVAGKNKSMASLFKGMSLGLRRPLRRSKLPTASTSGPRNAGY